MYAPGFRSYLVTAVYEYCMDHGFHPMVTVGVDDSDNLLASLASMGFVTLDLSNLAVRDLTISKDTISFRTRFQGEVAEIELDIGKVAWIGSACNTCGMRFDIVNESFNEPVKSVSDNKSAKTKKSTKINKENKAQPNLRLL